MRSGTEAATAGINLREGVGGYISGEKLLFSFLSRETQRKEKELVCASSHKERSSFRPLFQRFFPERETTGEFCRGDHCNRVGISGMRLCVFERNEELDVCLLV